MVYNSNSPRSCLAHERKVLVHPGSAASNGLDNVGTQTSSAKGDVKLRYTETAANTIALKAISEKAESEGEHDLAHESRHIDTGRDILNNNGVNVLMASLMSFSGIGMASWLWGVSLFDLIIRGL